MNRDLFILLIIELVGGFGLVMVQVWWKKIGLLNPNRFALINVAYITLLILTGFLAIPIQNENPYVFVGIVVIWWVGGIPFARWIYKLMISDK